MSNEPDTIRHSSSAEGITTIAIDRPHRRNAVDSVTAAKLYAAFIAFENDETQKTCIFTGVGDSFCAGADLQGIASHQGNELKAVESRNQGPMGPSRLQVRKPVICVITGYAVAGGLELSLIADLRIVEEGAVFGVFCRRWGVPLIDGGTVRLQRVVGLGRAMDMILTGRPVSAQEALGMGLANRVVARGTGLDEAWKLARELLAFPLKCMLVDRSSVYYSAYEANSLEDGLRYEFENGTKVVDTESVKGAAAFTDGAGRHGSFVVPKPKL